jgi:hypothetical protein
MDNTFLRFLPNNTLCKIATFFLGSGNKLAESEQSKRLAAQKNCGCRGNRAYAGKDSTWFRAQA